MDVKTCSKCKEEKPLDNFYKSKTNKDGYKYICKICYKEQRKEYNKNNKEKNKEKLKEYNIEYNKNNKEKRKEYYKNNIEKIKEYKKEYAKNNKEKIKEYLNNKIKTNPIFKLQTTLRNRNCKAFKSKSWRKQGSTEKMLGTTYEIAHKHLERQFTKGMNWDNHGEWHIDHIIPLASAKTEIELTKLCHYTNLQPLWAFDNISKGNKIIDTQVKLRI